MRIIDLTVTGLFGRDSQVVKFNFNQDINILTGRNGSGKTSILKLLWYILSGNILLALREVQFRQVTLKTNDYLCTIIRTGPQSCKVEFEDGNRSILFEDREDETGFSEGYAEDDANDILRECGSSVFLPTFRRIEGGFTTGSVSTNSANASTARAVRSSRNEIEESLSSLSKKLSNKRHVFVASISTVDIVTLLHQKYSALNDQVTDIQNSTSRDIISAIKAFKSDIHDRQIDAANETLDSIRSQIEEMERERETIMSPLEAVRKLIETLFRHTGIKMSGRLSFGDAANAVSSDALSAGEKQMLSFICYNAFYKDSVIIIDEPELSLHVDWQRLLFPTLLHQQSSNQFVIATHSPFIYSKYPEKELVVGSDRGDTAIGGTLS